MQNWKRRLSEIGDVETLDYAYMCEGRKRPDPLPKLIAAHREALSDARKRLGYPLCAMGDRTKLRDEVLRALNTPILFVQGTRDALCPLDLLEGVRAEMKTQNVLHVVDGGDHSLRVPKRQLQAMGKPQEDIDQRILEAVAGFVDQLRITAH